ncbi:MAG: SpoIIE family protein phosphatase [Bacteroidetes bacterium]|nr:SpoIIE family protein phosphatase [Bacteroidota bacterium]
MRKLSILILFNKYFCGAASCFGRILFFILLPAITLTAQKNNFKLRHITSKQGLTQSTVNCVFQDSRGFMWFGTQDGLNRYDGNKITSYYSDLDNKQSLAGSTVTTLIQDNEKRIWIGSVNNGISIYIPQADKFKRLVHVEKDKNTISDNTIKGMLYGSDNTVWVATANGLNAIDPKTFAVKRFFLDSSYNSAAGECEIYLVLENPYDKQVLVVTSLGVSKFDRQNGVFKSIPILGLGQFSISKAVFDKNQRVYISTRKSGIKVLDINTLNIIDNDFVKLIQSFYKPGEPFQITCSYKSPENISYLGTEGKGILVIDEKKKELTTINSDQKTGGLSSNNIQCIYFDVSGYMWVGTDLGVDFFQPGKLKFRTITMQDFEGGALKSNDIMSVLVDGSKLFLGTSNKGLNIIDQVTRKAVTLPKDINYGSLQGVLSLLKDKDGIYWIGTWGGGLVKLNLQKNIFKQFVAANSFLSGQNITCLAEHKNGVWIGSLEDGLYRIDKTDETFSKFTMNNGLSSNSIYFLGFDSNNKLWIGTNGGGLNIFDIKTNRIQIYKHDESNKNSLSSNIVNCIYIDKNKIAWIATDNGLNKFDVANNLFTRYYKKDGLPNNYIYSILSDNNGNLWMSTNSGLSKFNPNDENVEGSAFTNYGPDDGLQDEEFNQGAYFKGKRGELFFGGLNGLSVFYPDQLMSSSHIPPVYITSYKRFNKEVQLDTSISFKKHIEVSNKENSFSFEFTALDFDDPTRNKYSWKMEGLQNDWTPPTNRNIAEYPELSPGEYVFRVKASNSDGVWNNVGTNINITVRPPWYKTSWAYTSFVLTGLFGAWGYRLRVARQKRVLERMVEQRTVQLAEKNRDITSSIEYARKIQDAILPPLNDIFRAFPESFVLYKPRDIVSGDFYWFYEKGNKKVIAAVDCTGHGVPGAFMSMIGHNLLNQIVIENGITEAAEILNQLHKGVQAALKQGQIGVESKDGMDVSLCVFDTQKNELQYAGAYRTLYVLSDNVPDVIQKINGDKFPIGGSHFGQERSFTQHSRQLKKGDVIYMFTDGFADQFGGENGKKFMVKRFAEMLTRQWKLPLNKQHEMLEEAFSAWKGKNEQVDDVLIVGIKV